MIKTDEKKLTPIQQQILDEYKNKANNAYQALTEAKYEMYRLEKIERELNEKYTLVKNISLKGSLFWSVYDQPRNWMREGLQYDRGEHFYCKDYTFYVNVSERKNCKQKPFYGVIQATDKHRNSVLFRNFSELFSDNAKGHPIFNYDSKFYLIRRFASRIEAENFVTDWKYKLIETFSDSILFDYSYIHSLTQEEASKRDWITELVNDCRISER